MILGIPDLTLSTGHQSTVVICWWVDICRLVGDVGHAWGTLRYVANAIDASVSSLEIVIFAASVFLLLELEIIEVNVSTSTAISESRIIFKPLDVHDFATMVLALQSWRALNSVEVIDPRSKAYTCCK